MARYGKIGRFWSGEEYWHLKFQSSSNREDFIRGDDRAGYKSSQFLSHSNESDLIWLFNGKNVALQVECHPYLSQKRLGDWMADQNITLTAYSPLGSPDRPMINPDDPNLLADPRLLPLAEKYNKTPAQILLRFDLFYF